MTVPHEAAHHHRRTPADRVRGPHGALLGIRPRTVARFHLVHGNRTPPTGRPQGRRGGA